MKIINRVLLALMLLVNISACQDDIDSELYFIGDSIIARWDLPESFPSHLCKNDGKSGSGIAYIETLAGQFDNKDVVVIFGTNDNTLMVETTRAEFAQQYVNAIIGLKASRVYLFSVLPRCFAGDADDVNANIAAFNAIVKDMVENISNIIYIDVYQSFILNGLPNPQYYNDGLHLSPYGYEILTKALDNKL